MDIVLKRPYWTKCQSLRGRHGGQIRVVLKAD